MESPSKLPEWLNNVLATLPPNHAVRSLTLPPDHPTRKGHVDLNPDASEEGTVFAFQAPADGGDSANGAETEEQRIVTFRTTHDESMESHGFFPTASPACTVPFSTPGPGWMTSQASVSRHPRRPPSALCMSRPTGAGTPKALDTPLPFSTPGPFVLAQSAYGHVLDRSPTAQLHVACDTVLPLAEWSGATSFPKPRASNISGLDAYLPPDWNNGEEFLESFSSSPKFVLEDVAGPPPSLETVPPTFYVGSPTENPSFAPIPGMVATSPRSVTWGSPTVEPRLSGATDTTGRSKPAVFLSDIWLDGKASYGAFPLTCPQSRPRRMVIQNPHRSQGTATATGMSSPVTPPSLFSRRLPADLGRVPPDARIPDVFGDTESVNVTHVG